METENIRESNTLQFDLATTIWGVSTIAIALGYLRFFGQEGIVTILLILSVAAAVGGVVGSYVRRSAACTFWAMLGSCFAFMCSLTVLYYPPSMHLVWGMVGVATGTTIAACAGKVFRTMAAGALVGLLTMATAHAVLTYFRQDGVTQFDFTAAFAAGGLFACVVELADWLEVRGYLPRRILASILMLCVCGVNIICLFYIGIDEFRSSL